MAEFRIEKDSMGEVKVPAQAYYGAQTQRAVENFPISGQPLPPAADPRARPGQGGGGAGQPRPGQAQARISPSRSSRRRAKSPPASSTTSFPIDVYQTGSGTSSNMNANEVISNRAIELIGGDRFHAKKAVPSQRSCQHGAIAPTTCSRRRSTSPPARRFTKELIPALERLHEVLTRQGEGVGRHHQDRPHASGRRHADPPGAGIQRLRPATGAVPCDRAQQAHAGRSWNCRRAAPRSAPASTRIPKFGAKVAEVLAKETGIPFVEAKNHFEANANRDGLVECQRPAAHHRGHAVHRRQQHSLARLRPALRLLRNHAPRPPARLVDHAGQGQPGHVREHDASLRPRHRQRPDASPSPAPPAASSSSTS